jgi:hypothetical protein
MTARGLPWCDSIHSGAIRLSLAEDLDTSAEQLERIEVMECIRVPVPALAGSYAVVRQAHNGEIIRRITISFEGNSTPPGMDTFQIYQARATPVGAGTLLASIGIATFAAGVPLVGHLIYDFLMPGTEGAFAIMQENDLLVLGVTQAGAPQAFTGVLIGLA